MVLFFATVLAAEHFGGFAFYTGDLHVHTGISGDGGSSDLDNCRNEDCGNLHEVVQHAKDQALDFVSITDHVNNDLAGEADLWQSELEQVLAGNAPDAGFVTIPGAEVHFTMEDGTPIGHKNLFFFGDDIQLSTLTMEDTRFDGDGAAVDSCEAIWDWAQQLQAAWGPVMLIPHHTAGVSPMRTSWDCHDPIFQPGAEIYSEHGNSLSDDGYDPPWSSTVASGWVDFAIDPAGLAHQLAFFGSTDTHDTWPGKTCDYAGQGYGGGLAVVVLEEGEIFERSAIHDAVLDRRTYATSGPRVPVVLTWLADGVEIGGLGDHVTVVDGEVLEARVVLPEEVVPHVVGVDLVTPDDEHVATVDGNVWTHSFESLPIYAYVRVRLEGVGYWGPEGCDDAGASTEERLWLSPSWFTQEPAQPVDSDPPPVVDTSGFDTDPPVDTEPTVDSDPPEPIDRGQPDDGVAVDPEVSISPRCGGCGGAGAGIWILGLVALLRRREG